MPSIMFHLSDGLKDALGEYAGRERISLSEVIRRAVAREVGYDLNVEVRGRKRKYATTEERERASNERARERRRLTRALLGAQSEAELEGYKRALRESLRLG